MIDYGPPASNQMQFDFGKGAERMAETKEWVKSHELEWLYFKQEARRQTAARGYASAKLCVELTRFYRKVSIYNAYAPYLARLAMQDEPGRIIFKTAKSDADGHCKVKL